MDLIKVIKARRSIREYKDRPIPKEILADLIDAARFAPTARGVQPWEFIVITEEATLKKIAGLAENGRFIASARACIAVFCRDTKYYLEDGCAATQNLLLAATGYGIGSCWVAGDKKPYCAEVAGLLNVADSLKLVSLVALGYPAAEGSFKEAAKKGLDKIMHWEKF
ncbi:MAG: nitroreductase family protein [Candidatus Omnitrophica bacterium]|nr:nitroreductase family protein [Candidatus Omnitrophota bacterium]